MLYCIGEKTLVLYLFILKVCLKKQKTKPMLMEQNNVLKLIVVND